MTVAKAMKSPGQKMKSPKGPATPNVKSPKGKGPSTPKGTPNVAKTPKGTPNVAKTPKGTPNVAKTPKGTPMVAKTPKETPKVAKTPKETPKVAKTPKGTPMVAKTPKETPKVAKTPVVAGKQSPKATPKVGKTPVANGKQSPKATPKLAKTPVANGKQSPKATPSVAKNAAVDKRTPKASLNVSAAANKGKLESPKQKRSASAAGLDKENFIFRTIQIFNVPDIDSAFPKVRQLLEPRGEILQMKRFKDGIRVTFNTPEEARAAKKLNGVVFSGRNLSISHIDDKKLPITNTVVLTNIPTNITDQDVWTAFGNCGKILRIHMNRTWRTQDVQKTFVTFETEAGAKAALHSANKEIRGKQVKVTKHTQTATEYFPIENTIYLSNIRLGVSDNDIKTFLKNAGPVSGIQIFEGKSRLAMVYMTNTADVEKAVKLSGSSLKNSAVTITRHKKSTGYTAQSPVKKQKLNGGATKATQAAVEVESEDDDEDDEDDSDEDASEADLLAFQGQLQKLKAAADEDDDDEDEEDEDDDEDEEDGDDEGEEEEDSDVDGEEEDDDDDEDDDDEEDDDE